MVAVGGHEERLLIKFSPLLSEKGGGAALFRKTHEINELKHGKKKERCCRATREPQVVVVLWWKEMHVL